jgi:glutamine cyclotransferase
MYEKISTFVCVMKKPLLYIVLFVSCVLLTACESSAQNARHYTLQVEESLPHDVSAYTQGLFFYEGELYESCGQYGESSFRKVELATGKVLNRINFDRKYFLEGACALKGRIYILTWQENTCFVYDIKTMSLIGSVRYRGEGWGLTTDGKYLIMSDGSSSLTFRNPDNFKVEKQVTVTLNGKSLRYLNELEYINGEIWANVYGSDAIVTINPSSGAVTGMIDCRNLLPSALRKPSTDVLNGIAYNDRDGAIWLTGKYWPKIFRVTLVEKQK